MSNPHPHEKSGSRIGAALAVVLLAIASKIVLDVSSDRLPAVLAALLAAKGFQQYVLLTTYIGIMLVFLVLPIAGLWQWRLNRYQQWTIRLFGVGLAMAVMLLVGAVMLWSLVELLFLAVLS